jgi:outer membrane biosynthesis protein TonB
VISGPPLLRDAATAAVQQWKYRPYIADGNKPVAVNATVLMDFQLP